MLRLPPRANVQRATPIERPFPFSDPAFTYGGDDPVAGGLQYVFVETSQMAAMVSHARAAGNREVGGALLGTYCIDPATGRPFVLVLQAEPCTECSADAVGISFPPQFWIRIDRLLSTELNGLQRLGNYHSHPGYGVWPSGIDLETFRTAFRLPHQVMLIVDPKRNEVGCTLHLDGLPSKPTGPVVFSHNNSRSLWGAAHSFGSKQPNPGSPPAEVPDEPRG